MSKSSRKVIYLMGAGMLVIAGSYPAFIRADGPRNVAPDAVVIPIVPKGESYVRQRGLPDTAALSSGVAPTAWGQESRTIDGTMNNLANPNWGAAGENFLRLVPADYGDSISTPAGATRPSPRAVSNAVCAQLNPFPNGTGISDYLWMWGQLVDHDLDLAPTAAPSEPFDVPVPTGDPFFDPASTGTQVIPLDRSAYDPASGTGMGNPRQQVNILTAYIDASNVYGSDPVRADALRANDGTGRLKVSTGNLLPFNTPGLENAGGTGSNLFLAGDVRANEQIMLTALHTLFVREHNRLAVQFRAAEPGLTDEEYYQRARAVVGALMQVVTYKEWLPLLVGPDALTPYAGYDPAVNVGVSNEFATACFRVGHTMLSPQLMRLTVFKTPIAEGHLALRDAFFATSRLTEGGGIEPLFRGGAFQMMQEIDGLIIDDVRNFLFGPPGSGGFDLVSLNIQRGREHGLPTYNALRAALGLPAATSFADITSNPTLQAGFASVYADVNEVDLWIGAVSEDHYPGGKVGPLNRAVLSDQFRRLRDGDRFWYQNVFSGALLDEIENTRLSDIIRRNMNVGDELQDNVFLALQDEPIPTVSTWGLMALGLLLLTMGKVLYGRSSLRTTTANT